MLLATMLGLGIEPHRGQMEASGRATRDRSLAARVTKAVFLRRAALRALRLCSLWRLAMSYVEKVPEAGMNSYLHLMIKMLLLPEAPEVSSASANGINIADHTHRV